MTLSDKHEPGSPAPPQQILILLLLHKIINIHMKGATWALVTVANNSAAAGNTACPDSLFSRLMIYLFFKF